MEETKVFKGRQFSKDYQPPNRGNKHSVAWHLTRLLRKKIDWTDPYTKKVMRGSLSKIIALRLIYNACDGNNEAIKEVLDRIDGKNIQKILNEGQGLDTKLVIIRAETKPIEDNSSTIKPIQEDKGTEDKTLNGLLCEEKLKTRQEIAQKEVIHLINSNDVFLPNEPQDNNPGEEAPIISISPKGQD